jgi:type IX secretion system PorP/SprF family membrane protein
LRIPFEKNHIYPGYAGFDSRSVSLFYHNQWVDIKGSPESYAFLYQDKYDFSRMGFAISFRNDHVNIIGRSTLTYTNSYSINFNSNSSLYFGLSLLLNRNRIDSERIVNSTINDKLLQQFHNSTNLEGSFGLGFCSRRLITGFSVDQLFQNRIAFKSISNQQDVFLRFLRHYTFFYRYEFPLKKDFKIYQISKASVIQGLPAQIEAIGILNYKDKFSVGAIFKTNSIGWLIDFDFNNFYEITYRSDLAPLINRTIGGLSHEVSLRFNLDRVKKNKVNEVTNEPHIDQEYFESTQLNELILKQEVLESEINEIKKELGTQTDVNDKSGSSKYYVITGTFSSLRNAKIYQKVLL